MSELRKDNTPYIGYEYMEVDTAGPRASMYLDCYQSFGWEEHRPDENTGSKRKIVMRRNRKLIHKVELTRLQRHFEACMDEIAALEKSKTEGATIWALVIALLGTAFMAGSVFAVTHVPPLILLTILLAIPGFVGWILPYFVYRRLVDRRTKTVTVLIEQKYDEIYSICEQGSQLLN